MKFQIRRIRNRIIIRTIRATSKTKQKKGEKQ